MKLTSALECKAIKTMYYYNHNFSMLYIIGEEDEEENKLRIYARRRNFSLRILKSICSPYWKIFNNSTLISNAWQGPCILLAVRSNCGQLNFAFDDVISRNLQFIYAWVHRVVVSHSFCSNQLIIFAFVSLFRFF